MRSEIRELEADFKAAARIGLFDSLQVALDGLRELPEVAGNASLSDSFLDQVIQPLGEALIHPRLAGSLLLRLLDDPLAAVRAVAAVALASRYCFYEDVTNADLRPIGLDRRSDVRLALAKGLAAGGARCTQLLLDLSASWLIDPSPRLRETALFALAGLPAEYGEMALGQIRKLGKVDDTGVRAALVECLNALAHKTLDSPILDLLFTWAEEQDPDVWVIAKTLSASWARNSPQEANVLLDKLEEKTGPSRLIKQARETLHG
jgi:HEAT repeat protein